MSQEQNKTISGSVLDVYTPASQEYKENRMPRVGQTVEFEDGRKYVFCSTAVDVENGEFVASAAGITGVTSKIQAAGTREVRIVQASITQNQLAGGQLILEGTGVSYKIKSNTASATVESVANVVLVTLYDPLTAATTDGEAYIASVSKVENVVLSTAGSNVIGVAVVDVLAATGGATHYFWAQYQGLGSILDTAAAAGATLASGAAGLAVAATGVEMVLGTKITAGTDYDRVYLSLDGGC